MGLPNKNTLLFVVCILLTACAGPTSTPLTQTIFTAAPATHTPVPPPSRTPAAPEANSSLPASATPVKVEVEAGPGSEPQGFHAAEGHVIRSGEGFPPIDLAACLEDSKFATQTVTWHVSTDGPLDVQIIAGSAQVSAHDPTWSGEAQVTFQGCTADGACAELPLIFLQQLPQAVQVTFVNNEGFVIEAGDKKVLIDALFWGNRQARLVPVAQASRMGQAIPPFDDIDLILITHDHFDHFDPEITGENLLNNPTAVLLSTEQVTERLGREFEQYGEIQDRVIGLNLDRGAQRSLVIGGLGVEVLNFPHGIGAPQNIAFILTIGGLRLLHTGDLVPEETPRIIQDYNLPDRPLDVAFVPYFWFTNQNYRTFFLEGLNAAQIVPMHYIPANNSVVTASTEEFPQAVLFSEPYDTLTFEK